MHRLQAASYYTVRTLSGSRLKHTEPQQKDTVARTRVQVTGKRYNNRKRSRVQRARGN